MGDDIDFRPSHHVYGGIHTQLDHTHTGSNKCSSVFLIFPASGSVSGTAMTRTAPLKSYRKNLGNRSDSGLPTLIFDKKFPPGSGEGSAGRRSAK